MQTVWRRFAIPAVLGISVAVSSTNASADPVTIDFSAAPPTFTSYTEAGVTFSAVDGSSVSSRPGPNGTRTIIGLGEAPYAELKATSAAGFDFVSVDLGDYAGDADTLFLQAFSSTNTLVASVSLLLAQQVSGMRTLTLPSLVGADVRYVVFGSRAPSLNGSSVFADNFQFESAGPVPEPTSMFLLGTGLLGVGVRRWRQKVA